MTVAALSDRQLWVVYGPLRQAAIGQKRTLMTDRFRPILLKKSAMVSAAEKYASEIEIFTFG